MNYLKRLQAATCVAACLTLSLPVSAYDAIVSATGNASEMIAALGEADKLVAVDTTSTLPEDIMAEKPTIGYRRALSAEGILSMQPDLLILAPDAGPPTVVAQIEAAEVPTLIVNDEKTVAGVIANIELLADTLDVSTAAQPLVADIRQDEADIATEIGNYARTPKIAFFMDGGTGQNQLMGLGSDTAGDAMITIVGGENVFADVFSSVKSVSLESLIDSDADIILIAAHGSGVEAGNEVESAMADYPNLALTAAAEKQCIFKIGTVEALGFGSGFSKVAKNIVSHIPECL